MSYALPEKFMAWHSSPALDHTGTWATTRYPEDAEEYVKVAALPGMVKPLVWVRHPIGWNCEGFMIDARNPRAIYMMRGLHGKPRFDSVPAAKAAAQAHHVAQIMAAFGIDAGAMREGKDA